MSQLKFDRGPGLGLVKPRTDRAAYKAAVRKIQSRGNWFPVPRVLCGKVGVQAASLLMYLLSVGCGNADLEGWIWATADFIEDGLGMPPERQARVIDRLKTAGLLEVAGDHYRISLTELRQLLKGVDNA